MLDGAQARAYAAADFDEPHDRFVALLRDCFPHLPEAGAALDLGCGTGDISIRFARAFSAWTVDGLDGSTAMLERAREAVRRAGLTARVNLVASYLPGGDAPRNGYDLIFSNSLLHHLADPAVLWSSLRRWAPRGTPVFMMDLLRPRSREEARELVDRYAEDEPDILQRDFFNSLLAAYRPSEVRSQLQEAGLCQLRIRTTSDRHFIVWGHC